MRAYLANGTYFLDREASSLERRVLSFAENLLDCMGYSYLSVPTLVSTDTFEAQGVPVIPWYLGGDREPRILGGSAEQGILEMIRMGWIAPEPGRYWAMNHCFRGDAPEGLKYVVEFRKVEQYAIVGEGDWKATFEQFLKNAEDISMMAAAGRPRRRDATGDPGYHYLKIDLDVPTRSHGDLEICSCTYFGPEQLVRMGIEPNGLGTISCTAAALPRLLIPRLEKEGGYPWMENVSPCGPAGDALRPSSSP
jgi:hypothetical protein